MSLRDIKKRQTEVAKDSRKFSKFWKKGRPLPPLQGREGPGSEKGRSSGTIGLEKPGK